MISFRRMKTRTRLILQIMFCKEEWATYYKYDEGIKTHLIRAFEMPITNEDLKDRDIRERRDHFTM